MSIRLKVIGSVVEYSWGSRGALRGVKVVVSWSKVAFYSTKLLVLLHEAPFVEYSWGPRGVLVG